MLAFNNLLSPDELADGLGLSTATAGGLAVPEMRPSLSQGGPERMVPEGSHRRMVGQTNDPGTNACQMGGTRRYSLHQP